MPWPSGSAHPVAGLRRRLPRFPSRLFWTFSDQALSSVTNAALAIVVARSVSSERFGAFALALVTFGFVIGLLRAFVGEPFVVKFSGRPVEEQRRGAARAGGAALSLGALAAVLCLAVAAVIRGETAAALVALALALPGLALQDTWRHVFFATGRPRGAAANDFVWAVLQAVFLAAVLVAGDGSIFWITLSWGGAACLAAAFGAYQARVLPSILGTRAWLTENRYMGVRLGFGFALNMGAVNLVTFSIGGLVGIAALGAVRAAQTVLGPLNLLFAGFNAFMLPVLSGAATSGRRLLRLALAGSALTGLIAAVWVAVMVLLPADLGRVLLGDSWAGASSVMLPAGLVMVLSALAIGASNSLVALQRADLMLKVVAVQAVLMLVLGVTAAWQLGVAPAVYGMVVAQAVGLALSWVMFTRADADPRRHTTADRAPAGPGEPAA